MDGCLVHTIKNPVKLRFYGIFLNRSFNYLFAESEGFEPPVPRRVQQISSLPRSTTPAALLLQAQI